MIELVKQTCQEEIYEHSRIRRKLSGGYPHNQNEKGSVRSIDIANHLNFSKPSVSVAMKNLRENGYISIDPDGSIHLEESGRKIAEKIYERHTLLSDWLTRLGVPRDIATEDACRIEHVISEESFSAIKGHVKK